MELIFKAVIVGVTGAVLTVLIKKTNPEIATVLAFAVCSLIAGLGMRMLSSVMELISLAQAPLFSAAV